MKRSRETEAEALEQPALKKTKVNTEPPYSLAGRIDPKAEDSNANMDLGLAERIVGKWQQIRKEDGTLYFPLEAGIEEKKTTKWETKHKVPLPDSKGIVSSSKGNKALVIIGNT